jgi:hypothetical protein
MVTHPALAGFEVTAVKKTETRISEMNAALLMSKEFLRRAINEFLLI